jgi:phage terminase large subunit GpA-like protein
MGVSTMGSAKYLTLADLIRDAAKAFKPPERLTVTEAAVKYQYLRNEPKYSGPYKPEETPYMIEPQNNVISPFFKSVVFCGPSQTGKTEAIILNGICYFVKCSPMDVILYGPSQPAARDFSKRRIDRMHRNSKYLRTEILPGQHNDNTHDKLYKSGMLLSISWPSLNEMSSKPVPVTMLTEYDRMPDDIDGEGSPFLLAQKRTTTYGDLAMTVVDSSPARDITDPKWKPQTPHEAPPCDGILGLYNQGDRRRWYWPCTSCGNYFETSFSDLKYETHKLRNNVRTEMSIFEKASSVYVLCPCCEHRMTHESKREMNIHGVWLRDGEMIRPDGTRYGEPVESDSATYWLKGPAAAYATWTDLVLKQLKAEEKYIRTGSQEDLKTVANTDHGEPYVPKGTEASRLAEDIMDTKDDSFDVGTVPEGVVALMAMIDVQKNRWEVQVMGVRPQEVGIDYVVIDRFPIVKSRRVDDEGDTLWVKPATHAEDWDLLEELVMQKRYPLAGGAGTMGICMTGCDSGGKAGVTSMAYNFWRKLRDERKSERFILIKGSSNPASPRAAIDFPDTKRKDRHAMARGEIPVLFLNSNSLKDMLDGLLDTNKDEKSISGRLVFPSNLPISFYEQLTVEVKTPKGWENTAKRPNEAWDLLYYFIGVCTWRKLYTVDWDAPPSWLKPWPENPHVILESQAQKEPVDKPEPTGHLISDLGRILA